MGLAMSLGHWLHLPGAGPCSGELTSDNFCNIWSVGDFVVGVGYDRRDEGQMNFVTPPRYSGGLIAHGHMEQN